MKLDDHLRVCGTSNADFGRAIDASEATVSRLRNGKQRPSNALMERIIAATGGAVLPNDFFETLEFLPAAAQQGAAA